MTTLRVVMDEIINGEHDTELERLAHVVRSRMKAKSREDAAHVALSTKPGDIGHLVRISPKYLELEKVEVVDHDRSGKLLVKLIGKPCYQAQCRLGSRPFRISASCFQPGVASAL